MIRRKMPDKIWSRGQKIVASGNVEIEMVDEEFRYVKATVFGTHPYDVTVTGDGDDFCTCPYFAETGYCKHVAALLILIEQAAPELQKIVAIDQPTADFNRQYMTTTGASKPDFNGGTEFFRGLNLVAKPYYHPLDQTTNGALALEVSLLIGQVVDVNNFNTSHDQLFLKMKVASRQNNKFYVVQNMSQFLQAYQSGSSYQTGGRARLMITRDSFNNADQKLLDCLIAAPQAQVRGRWLDMDKCFAISPATTVKVLNLANNLANFTFQPDQDDDEQYDQVELKQFDARQGLVSGRIISDQMGYNFTMHTQFEQTLNEDTDGTFIVDKNIFYQIKAGQLKLIVSIMNSYFAVTSIYPSARVNEMQNFKGLHFNKGDEELLNQFVSLFKQIGQIEVPADLIVSEMTPYFDLDVVDDNVELHLGYGYGDQIIDPTDVSPALSVKRNLAKEGQTTDYLTSLGFSYHDTDRWTQPIDDAKSIYEFFSRKLPNLRLNGQVMVSKELQSLVQDVNQFQPAVNVKEVKGYLSVEFSFAGIDEGEVDHILKQLNNNNPYIEKTDGTIILVDEQLGHVSEALTKIRHQGKIQHGKMKVHASQVLAVEAALGQTGDFDQRVKELTNNLAHPENFAVTISPQIHGQLRPYQMLGVRWLEMLDSYGFGGILADEMGLGKTLQMISLLANHQDQERINLIVCPASLIYNWQAEFNKFAPDLKVIVVDGTKQERQAMIRDSRAQTLITSYNSARSDIEEYVQVTINYLVLDEAQYIKNASTKTNRSLQRLTPHNTFALSGTPIENRAEELWSIFQVVMPGLLPGKREFKRLTADEIAVRVKPFILRRQKKAVLTDLPPLMEANQYNELTKDQKVVYLAQLKQMQAQVEGMTDGGLVKNRMEILAGLTRLRQICDTPALYVDDYQGDSGKMAQLTEILTQAHENGRHVLIFSQFTKMLTIIKRQLTEMGMETFTLEGSTKPRDRVTMVNRFNRGEKDMFLISLKAGGTGLNLTGADLVVLVDLWWNPAVEDQATARAHRIGQTKQVEVFRLITKGTIEEQIYKLQGQKRDFVDRVLSGPDNKGSLTNNDIRQILGIND